MQDVVARETALLAAGNQRMLSPLEVKRRLRNRTQGQSLSLRHQFMARSSLSRTVDSAGVVCYVSCVRCVCAVCAVCPVLFCACCVCAM